MEVEEDLLAILVYLLQLHHFISCTSLADMAEGGHTEESFDSDEFFVEMDVHEELLNGPAPLGGPGPGVQGPEAEGPLAGPPGPPAVPTGPPAVPPGFHPVHPPHLTVVCFKANLYIAA